MKFLLKNRHNEICCVGKIKNINLAVGIHSQKSYIKARVLEHHIERVGMFSSQLVLW